jgi:hypothetical protein
MKVTQLTFLPENGWEKDKIDTANPDSQLIIVFGSRYPLEKNKWYPELRKKFLKADIVSLSTSGNIKGEAVTDDSIVASVLYFEKTRTKTTLSNIEAMENSFEAGKVVGSLLSEPELKHVLIFSDGNMVNGSELVKGLNKVLDVSITGGLAGDDARFEKTIVGLNNLPTSGNIVGIGFYGENIEIGYGHLGGWDPFGAERIVTKSKGNVLYDLDGKSALELYKNYLGEKANELPGSALLFPLGMKLKQGEPILTRTILNIQEDGGMVFAGDLPEGATVQLMKANFEKLIDASATAAQQSYSKIGKDSTFALLISCVGRKLVLGQRIEEEVEAVRDVLGDSPFISGFYSYGELSTILGSPNCELHNQTMTITLFNES